MKKIMKCVVLGLFFTLLSIPEMAWASEVEVPYEEDWGHLCQSQDNLMVITENIIDTGIQTYSSGEAYTESELLIGFENLIKEALLSETTFVKVDDSNAKFQSIKTYVFQYYSPYWRDEFSIYYQSESPYDPEKYPAGWKINSTLSLEATEQHFLKVDAELESIMQLISDDMSDEIKALVLHDYLVCESAYDYDNYLADTIPRESYTCRGILLNNTGVCNAYAYAYKYLVNKIGIECYVTSSEDMNHAWNIIDIDGEYYHVDATWDDPVRDRIGLVRHEHFLVSDSEMKELEHFGWDRTDLVSDDTRYEESFWRNMESQIIIDGSNAYYIDYANDAIYRQNLETGSSEVIKSLPDQWVGDSNVWWSSHYSGLFMENGALYYNTATEIRKINTDGTGDELVYAPDTTVGYIYGSAKKEDELHYFLTESAYTAHENGEIYTAPYTFEVEPTDIILSRDSVQLATGNAKQLFASLVPIAASGEVEWSSSDASIAAVSETGLVTAYEKGEVVITASVGDIIDTCKFTVVCSHPAYDEEVTEVPDCDSVGEKTFICKKCDYTWIETIQKLGHAYSEEWTIEKEPSCEIKGHKAKYCTRIGCSSYTNYTIIPALGHDWEDEYTVDDEPTCHISGWKSIHCSVCDSQKPGSAKNIPQLEHDWKIAFNTSATCTKRGETKKECNLCGTTSYEYTDAKGHKWNSVYTVDKEPTYENVGIKSIHCSVCDAKQSGSTVIIPTLVMSDPRNPFVDVVQGKYYYDSVLWAVDDGITTGKTATTFVPDEECTRAQVVTFLWRYYGCPEPMTTENPFVDVLSHKYYYKAVLWAYEKGITTGKTATTFEPDATVTREQFVTFLWRSENKPISYTGNPFADVPANRYSTTAILWAYENGITTGKSATTFEPASSCLRCQVVTFLYRASCNFWS